ncbi:alkaline phosphatase [Parapedomonas caeni]
MSKRRLAVSAWSLPLACLLALSSGADAQTDRSSEGYRQQGEAALTRLKNSTPRPARARNVIIFIGDGMGVSTLTAGRIFAGQSLGRDGESYETAMDSLDHAALVKTYSHDAQVADSASTATAIMTGVKTRSRTLGVGPEAAFEDCPAALAHPLPSLFDIAQQRRRATGVVTTTRITHATPAATYAHTPQRDWESDTDMPEAARREGCLDIARQLVEGPVGARLDVILGGGRAAFLPRTRKDPEYADKTGGRSDGRDLVQVWQRANPKAAFVWKRDQFAAVDPDRHTRLLGLFEPSHMQYEADRARDGAGEPSLAEMVETAIRMLSRNPQGYVLMVEGGRIDHAHHAGNAHRALADTKALDEAVATALRLVDLDDTLIITTADHSHTLSISGYPGRGNPILGTVAHTPGTPVLAKDKKAYTTLSYANGPGAVSASERPDPATTDTGAVDYRQQSLIPLSSETHGGEDVVVRASGAGAQLFRGTIEQHTIFYIVREALFGASDNHQ